MKSILAICALLCLQATTSIAFSEPRCSLTNMHSNRMLKVVSNWWGNNWWAEFGRPFRMSSSYKFKLQWCDKTSDGLVKTLLIRTDWHPQSLLDGDLKFKGDALDGSKCYVKHRWWDVAYVYLKSNSVVVVLKNRVTGRYLAEVNGRPGTVKLDDSLKLKDIPRAAMWEIHRTGSAPTPFEAGALVAAPAIVVIGAVGTAGAVAVAAGATAGIGLGQLFDSMDSSIVRHSELARRMKTVEDTYYVNW